MRTVNTDINAAEEKAARRAYNRSHIDCHVVCAVISLAFLALAGVLGLGYTAAVTAA